MLTKERKGEIALVLLKRDLLRSFHLREIADPSNVKKGIGQVSQETGIPRDELLDFVKEVGGEILNEVNGKLQSVNFSQK